MTLTWLVDSWNEPACAAAVLIVLGAELRVQKPFFGVDTSHQRRH